eukprot:301571-Prorocentrum_lima.AAC.1
MGGIPAAQPHPNGTFTPAQMHVDEIGSSPHELPLPEEAISVHDSFDDGYDDIAPTLSPEMWGQEPEW